MTHEVHNFPGERRKGYRRKEDRDDARQHRIKQGVRYGVVLIAVILGLYGSWKATQTANQAKTDSAELQKLATRAASVAAQSAATQHQLLVSQKASAETRVNTVTQRCNLTKQILVVLRRHDLGDVAPFERSYAECEAQLQTVKQIAKQTPSP
jgi:hypothetical protein